MNLPRTAPNRAVRRPRMRLVLLLAAAGGWLAPAAQAAEPYPSRPIKIVVGFEPGGSVDSVARLLAQYLSRDLGRPVVVENRPGAESNIGSQYVAQAIPDGYTLLLNTGALPINASLYRHAHYDPVRSFRAISMIGKSSVVLVGGPATGDGTFKSFMEKAREKPGEFNYSSAGGPQLVAAELFKQKAGLALTRIPYKGSAPAIQAVVSGEVQMSFSNVPTAAPQAKAGRLRILAVADETRNPKLPDVPTLREEGVPMTISLWYGLFAPAGTPPPVLDRLGRSVAAAAASPELRQRLADVGVVPVANDAATFSAQLAAEVRQWAEVVRISGARAD